MSRAAMLPAWTYRHARLLSLAAVAVSLAAWTLEWTGAVEPCIYCQVQRSVIGLLGLIGLAPHGLGRLRLYPSAVLAAFGVVAAGMQHMNGWAAWAKGEAASAPLWGNSFLLSACALAIIIGQWALLSSAAEEEK